MAVLMVWFVVVEVLGNCNLSKHHLSREIVVIVFGRHMLLHTAAQLLLQWLGTNINFLTKQSSLIVAI